MAFGPLAGHALADVWGGAAAPSGAVRAGSMAGAAVWLVEVNTAPASAGSSRPAPPFILGGVPFTSPGLRPDLASEAPVVRLSDRGWSGMPGDSALPNITYPPRLLEPPALERVFPVNVGTDRPRLARDGGEILLANADGGMDGLAADWSLAGRRVMLYRAPHTRPRHTDSANFTRIAELRAAGAFHAAGSRLRLPLEASAADLSVAVCETYAGTGDAEGPAEMAGQFKPRTWGRRRQVQPVQVSAALLVFQFHHGGPASSVFGARDRGVALTIGPDYPNYAALASATVAAGSVATCLAGGYVRCGAPPSVLTLDVDGEVGTAGAYTIAEALLRGPGGLDASRASGEEFAAWPSELAGLHMVGGSVGDALDTLAAGVGGVWGADAFGRFFGRVLPVPEASGVSAVLEPYMLAAPPVESEAPSPPWMRATVAYRTRAIAQAGEDLAGSVSAADRATWSRTRETVTAYDATVQARFPSAVAGPEILSVFDDAAPAQALANRLLALYAPPRRTWTVRMGENAGGVAWAALEPGAVVSLVWPYQAALASGRTLVVRGVSARGDRVELGLWG